MSMPHAAPNVDKSAGEGQDHAPSARALGKRPVEDRPEGGPDDNDNDEVCDMLHTMHDSPTFCTILHTPLPFHTEERGSASWWRDSVLLRKCKKLNASRAPCARHAPSHNRKQPQATASNRKQPQANESFRKLAPPARLAPLARASLSHHFTTRPR